MKYTNIQLMLLYLIVFHLFYFVGDPIVLTQETADNDDLDTLAAIMVGVIVGGIFLMFIFLVGTLLRKKLEALQKSKVKNGGRQRRLHHVGPMHGGYISRSEYPSGYTPPPSYKYEGRVCMVIFVCFINFCDCKC